MLPTLFLAPEVTLVSHTLRGDPTFWEVGTVGPVVSLRGGLGLEHRFLRLETTGAVGFHPCAADGCHSDIAGDFGVLGGVAVPFWKARFSLVVGPAVAGVPWVDVYLGPLTDPVGPYGATELGLEAHGAVALPLGKRWSVGVSVTHFEGIAAGQWGDWSVPSGRARVLTTSVGLAVELAFPPG